MVHDGDKQCPRCGGKLIRYGSVERKIRGEYGKTKWIRVQRMKCTECHAVHRSLPIFILPRKQYTADIIYGFLAGLYSSEDLEFEDFPHETTVQKWTKNQPTSL